MIEPSTDVYEPSLHIAKWSSDKEIKQSVRLMW